MLTRFAIDYWAPHPDLAGLVSGYHRYRIAAAAEPHRDVFYPGWANLRFQTEGEPIVVDGAAVPRDALFGATSRALRVAATAGELIGAGITPLGWYRLTRLPADRFADRVVPAAEALGPSIDALVETLRGARDGDDVRAAFDRWFLPRMSRARAGEDRIAAIHASLLSDMPLSVAETAARLGLPQRRLHRLATAAFGFGPKLLARRARFLRTLLALREPSPEPWATRIGTDYHDQSHFIRDCRDFLGMSPSALMALDKPMNDASTRLRARVLGAPAQALHPPVR